MDTGIELHRRLRELNYGKRHSHFLTKAIMRSVIQVGDNQVSPIVLTHKGKSHILPALKDFKKKNYQLSWK